MCNSSLRPTSVKVPKIMISLEQVLGPDDAVDRLGGRVADGAAGEGPLLGLGAALVTLEQALLDDGHLPEVAGSTALDQRHLGGEAEAVHVVARGGVVQGVHDEVKLLEKVDSVLRTTHKPKGREREKKNSQ